MSTKADSTAKPDPRSQAEKFHDLAVELECDDDEAAFAEKVKQLAKAKPKPAARPAKK